MNKLIKQAFTLIELLVVIAIIGILSGLIVVSMGGMTTKASIAKSQIFANSLRNSLMLNLVSEWKLDQISGSTAPYTTLDSWSSGNTGTLMNGTSNACSFSGALACPQLVTSNCVSGNCFSFDGADDYVQMSNPFSSMPTNLSISGWVYDSDNSSISNTRVISLNFDSNNYVQFCVKSINIPNQWSAILKISGTEYSVYTSFLPSINDWHHFAITKSGTTATLYIDGVPYLITGNSGFTGAAGNFLIIGSRDTVSSGTFKGKVDDFRVFNASIPTSQIKEQYYAGLNSLLANSSINVGEYAERINSIAMQ